MRQDRPGLSALGSSSGAVSDWKRTSPPLAASICAIMLSSVVLPAPDGPMMVRNSPSATEKLRSWITQGGVLAAGARRRSACRDRGLRAAAAAMAHVPACMRDVRRRAPAQQPPLDRVDAPVAEEHDAGRRRERDEHAGGVEIHRAELHQIAEPAIGGDQLGDHRAADRIRHGDAQAGEDVGHRARKHDVARDVRARCAPTTCAICTSLVSSARTPASALK